MKIQIDGRKYAPVDEEGARVLGERLRSFTLEGDLYWRKVFIERDTNQHGARYGMYSDGDELAPFFSEAFLYNLLGKDSARSVLGIVRGLCVLAGVEFR